MFGRITRKNEHSQLDEMAILLFLRQWWREHAFSVNDRILRTILCTDTLRFARTNLPPQRQKNTSVGVNCSEYINPPSVIDNGKVRIDITYTSKERKIIEEFTTYKFLLPDDFDKLLLPLWKFEKL